MCEILVISGMYRMRAYLAAVRMSTRFLAFISKLSTLDNVCTSCLQEEEEGMGDLPLQEKSSLRMGDCSVWRP